MILFGLIGIDVIFIQNDSCDKNSTYQIFQRLYFLISILVVNIVTVFVTFRPIMDLIQKFPNHTQIIITLSLGKLTYYTGTKILKFARPLLIFWEALRF